MEADDGAAGVGRMAGRRVGKRLDRAEDEADWPTVLKEDVIT